MLTLLLATSTCRGSPCGIFTTSRLTTAAQSGLATADLAKKTTPTAFTTTRRQLHSPSLHQRAHQTVLTSKSTAGRGARTTRARSISGGPQLFGSNSAPLAVRCARVCVLACVRVLACAHVRVRVCVSECLRARACRLRDFECCCWKKRIWGAGGRRVFSGVTLRVYRVFVGTPSDILSKLRPGWIMLQSRETSVWDRCTEVRDCKHYRQQQQRHRCRRKVAAHAFRFRFRLSFLANLK
jgi:hypothetical protein